MFPSSVDVLIHCLKVDNPPDDTQDNGGDDDNSIEGSSDVSIFIYLLQRLLNLTPFAPRYLHYPKIPKTRTTPLTLPDWMGRSSIVSIIRLIYTRKLC